MNGFKCIVTSLNKEMNPEDRFLEQQRILVSNQIGSGTLNH